MIFVLEETAVTSDPRSAYLQGAPLKITVRYLRAQNDGAEVSVGVQIESGEHREQKNLLLTMQQYCEWKICKGEISEETYDRLEEASRFCYALRCGENLLSYGSNTRQMLARKLMQRGYSKDVSERAAERLQEMGLLNESEDLRREVEKCLRKLWGRSRISTHLWSRGFGEEAMELFPQTLEEVDFAANCAALIEKHYGGLPKDQPEQKRMMAGLSRYGYSFGEIREAFRILSEENRI